MSEITNRHQEDVKRFFDGYASDFHAIYGRKNASTLGGLIDRLTRQGMFARFEEAFQQCRAQNARSLLDVGCGPGVHDTILADRLKMHVRGIDIAPRMIEIAKKNAEAKGVSSLCDYSVMNFLDFESGRDYDMTLSLGVVEYIEEPADFIVKMMSHTKKRVMFSLPVKWHALTPQRFIRYKVRKCPLKFYSVADIEALMKRCGATSYEVKRMNRDFLVIISTE